MRFTTGRFKAIAATAFLLLFASFAPGQEANEEDFAKRSLDQRTRLHYDPLLDAPLDALVKLYQEAERVDELIGLYQSHIEQYADDAGAKVVLVRILRKVDRAGADELIAKAVPLHPNSAPLQYMLFRFLEERGDERATEALSRAIDLETNPSYRGKWLDELLQLSEGEAGRALAGAQLQKILAPENQSAESLMNLARLMQRYLYWELSLEALNKAKSAGLSPEATVEAEILSATAQAKLGDSKGAGKRLDAVLKKLAADHWRRREVMSLRVGVLATEEEREAMLKTLRRNFQKNPNSETAILDLAELLVAMERRSEAVDLLVQSAEVLPQSQIIESRAVDLLESVSDYGAYKTFLEQRLETNPERSDLRFRLVQIEYALGNDAEAEQEFKAVIAGLKPEEISTKILELQRFLRSIDRIEAAAKYLEQYVRNHPDRFDVARELIEIYNSRNNRAGVERVVNALSVENAPIEDVVDLGEFLLAGDFYVAAKGFLGKRVATAPEQFDLGLLHVRALSEVGDQSATTREIGRLRENTDTPARYAKWLETAAAAHDNFETTKSFFDGEQNRFIFDDAPWSQSKIEKFLVLCEIGSTRLATDSVASAVRERLAQTNLEPATRTKLRLFLVGLLEDDPAAAAEVEQQLSALATEDPANVAEYNLRRALVFHRGSRVDLAEEILAEMDPEQISSPNLLREAVDVLIDYRFFDVATRALAKINQIDPQDLFSWEERLSLLMASGNETAFRSVIRTLRNGDAGIDLREQSRLSLDEHLVASYWRSISRLLKPENQSQLEEVLPLLASVDREEVSPETMAWTEWSRAVALATLGRSNEASESLKRFESIAKQQKLESVSFPDGLTLSVDSAGKIAGGSLASAQSTGVDTGFVFGDAHLLWAFELEAGAKLARAEMSGNKLILLDDHDIVYAVDATTGKLLWRDRIASQGRQSVESSVALFPLAPEPATSDEDASKNLAQAKKVRPFEVVGDLLIFLGADELRALSAADGSLSWAAPLPFESGGESLVKTKDGALPEATFGVSEEMAIVFHPFSQEVAAVQLATGKLLWRRELSASDRPKPTLISLNSGVSVSSGVAFVYGTTSTLLDMKTGETLWNLSGGSTAEFPIVIRENHGGEGLVSDAAIVEVASDDSKSWKKGPNDAAAETPLSLVDFMSVRDLDFTHRDYLQGRSSLIGPSVHWTETRLSKGTPALGILDHTNLWLMQGESAKRVSTRFPAASQELPADGVFVGARQSHAWFLDGTSLLHVDFHRNRTTRISVADLGGESSIGATLSGNQLLVRGQSGVKAINALTGRVIGQANWPVGMAEFLKERFPDLGVARTSAATWQGRIASRGPGQPGYCFPIPDLLSEDRYIVAFGGGTVVGIGPKARQAPPRPAPRAN